MEAFIRKTAYREEQHGGLVFGFTEPILTATVNNTPEYSNFSAIDWFSYYIWEAYMKTLIQALSNFLELKGVILTKVELADRLKGFRFTYDSSRLSVYGPLNPLEWQSCLLNLHIDAIIDGFVNVAKDMNVYCGHEEIKLFLLRSSFQPSKFPDQDDKLVCTHFAKSLRGRKPRPCKDAAKPSYSKCAKHLKELPETSPNLRLIYRDCTFIPGPFTDTLVEKKLRGVYTTQNSDFSKLILIGKMVNGHIYTSDQVFNSDDLSYARYFNAETPPEAERMKILQTIILNATAAGRPYIQPPSLEEKEEVFNDARIKTPEEIVDIQLKFPMEKRGQFLVNHVILFCKSNTLPLPENGDYAIHTSINGIYESFVKMSFNEKMRALLSAYSHFYPTRVTDEMREAIIAKYT